MSEYSAPTQFIDLEAQQKLIRPQLENAIKKVLDHGQYIMGPEVKEFECRLREFTGVKHALTCANGTDALTLVLMSWGVGQMLSLFRRLLMWQVRKRLPSWVQPHFLWMSVRKLSIDPQSFKQAVVDSREFGLKPTVVIAVDLFGQPADVDAITDIAHAEGIKVLVDGAQSFGATSKRRTVGSMGMPPLAFSRKPLGCYGDGGAVFTDCDEVAELVNSIRLHGKGSRVR